MRAAQEFFEEAAGIGADGHPLNEGGERPQSDHRRDTGSPKWNTKAAEQEWKDNLTKRLSERRFDLDNDIIRPEPAFCVAGIGISTAGNLTAISAASKAGKSAFVSAMQASAMNIDSGGRDFLGVSSANLRGAAMVHMDTEQSRSDHHESVLRTLRRAGIEEPPPWFRSYCVTGFTALHLRAALKLELEAAEAKHGGLHSVFIDGIGDLVLNVNDAAEANEFVAELHALAIDFDCPIICIIHTNPNGEKTRGHLGSQLERKAETNLRLDKGDEVTVVWSDRNRRAPIPKDKGPRFAWSEEHAMHMTTETIGTSKVTAKKVRHTLIAESVFQKAGCDSLPWKEFLAHLGDMEGLTPAGARKRMDVMIEAKVITKKDGGHWTLTKEP